VSRGLAGVLATTCFGLALLAPSKAGAQQYLLGTSGELATGLEGGGGAETAMYLARLRLRLALDLRVDEFPADIYSVGLLLEVEPHSAFGIDARYMRRLGTRFEVNVGGIAFVAPESLIGPSAGLKYRFSLSSATQVTVGPEVNVFVIGSDLPDGTIVWQALIQAGIHADL
jgi:hypothetical protein